MQLGEIVKELRTRNSLTLKALAERVKKAGGKTVPWQSLQQLELKPDTSPRFLPALAAAFGKTVEELLAWRPGMPELGSNSGQRIADPEELSPGLMASRFKHDIDQMRITLLAMLDVFSATIPGAADDLLNRLEFAVPEEYAQRGFHARVLSVLKNLAQKQEAARAASLPPATRGPSPRKRPS